MSPLIEQIISFINLAIKTAPAAKQVYEDGRALVDALFLGKLITKEQQDSLMQWADAHQAAVLSGEVPPEFKVE